MKTFASASFYRLMHVLIDESHTDKGLSQWTHRGIEWERIHHSFTGPVLGFGIHQYRLVKPGPQGWSFIFVRENWWSNADGHNLRSNQWAKPLSGRRNHIWEWLHEEEHRLIIDR